jgi:hypothetical protein
MVSKAYAMAFISRKRIQEFFIGTIEEYWNNIYDLLYISDFMVLRPADRRALKPKEVRKIMRLLIEDMSEDGWPLIWRLYRDVLFVAVDERAAPFGQLAYKQYRAFLPLKQLEEIFEKSTIHRMETKLRKKEFVPPKRYQNYDFDGFLSKEVIKGEKEPPKLRPTLENITVAAGKVLVHTKSDYAKQRANWVIAMKPALGFAFTRDPDFEELVDFLYDEMRDFSEALEGDLFRWSTEKESLLQKFLDHMKEVHDARYVGIDRRSLTIEKLATLLKDLKIDNPYFDWYRRCIVKLYKFRRLRNNPQIRELALYLFDLLEELNEDCIWCGQKNITKPDHFFLCSMRQDLLSGS